MFCQLPTELRLITKLKSRFAHSTHKKREKKNDKYIIIQPRKNSHQIAATIAVGFSFPKKKPKYS